MPDRLHQVPTPQGTLQYRRAGAAATPTHVLLHGIGSASGSWLPLLERLQADPAWGALAWDAPGYGASTPLPMARPRAEDYGRAVWAWLDALSLRTPVVLVGHSLGALMAAAAAALAPERVRAVRLLSPARGYADGPEAEREAVRRQRLANLAQLGPAPTHAPAAVVSAMHETFAVLGVITALAITAHEIPQEIGDFIVLLNAGFTKTRAYVYNLICSLMSVVGGVVGYYALGEGIQPIVGCQVSLAYESAAPGEKPKPPAPVV